MIQINSMLRGKGQSRSTTQYVVPLFSVRTRCPGGTKSSSYRFSRVLERAARTRHPSLSACVRVKIAYAPCARLEPSHYIAWFRLGLRGCTRSLWKTEMILRRSLNGQLSCGVKEAIIFFTNWIISHWSNIFNSP